MWVVQRVQIWLVIVVVVVCGVLYDVAADTQQWNDSAQNENENVIDQHVKARSLLSNMAQSFLSRSGSNSQVVSLNLTNLFILVILKALIYAAGTMGAGAWKGRNLDGGMEAGWKWPGFSEPELLMYMGYLTGAPGHYDCLNQVACKNPNFAADYLAGARVLLRTAKSFESVLPNNDKYEQIVIGMKEAIEFGMSGGPCHMRYECAAPSPP